MTIILFGVPTNTNYIPQVRFLPSPQSKGWKRCPQSQKRAGQVPARRRQKRKLKIMAKRPILVRFGNPNLILVPENWKDAEGVSATHRESNSVLAQRDYKCNCDVGSEPVVVVEGFHIWWCKTHHQPFFHCERKKNNKFS